MKLILRSLTLLQVLVITIVNNSFSQTIDYANWTPPSPVPCNIFGSSKVINGSTHLSNIGQPRYSGQAINLDCSNTNEGTEYQLTYNFKQGFRYTITVKAANIQSTPSAFSYLRLRINNSGAGVNTLCDGDKLIDVSTSGPLMIGKPITSGSFVDYVYEFPVLGAPNSHLQVAAVPAAGASAQTMLVKSIQIVETAVSPELVLSPTTVNTVCGTNLTQTFTVSNPHNVTGITSYEWNLGSVANGWLYNGSAAPQNISTTTNTLTLVANGCRTTPLSNVIVTVNKNGSAYKTYTATTQTAQPTFTITGPDRLCSGTANYGIAGLPCNAAVSWSVQAGSGSSLGCTPCAQTSLQFVSEGSTTLTASVQLPCNPSPIIIQKEISTGDPKVLAGIIYSTNDGAYQEPFMRLVNGGTSILIQLPALSGFTSYAWSIRGDSDPSFTFNESPGYNFQAYFNSPTTPQVTGTILFKDLVHPQCGSITLSQKLTFYINPGEGQLQVQASPVPANNILNVMLTSENNDQFASAGKSATPRIAVSRIQVVDKMGNVKIDQRSSTGTFSTSVDVSALANDVYILKVFDGRKWWSKQIIVRH